MTHDDGLAKTPSHTHSVGSHRSLRSHGDDHSQGHHGHGHGHGHGQGHGHGHNHHGHSAAVSPDHGYPAGHLGFLTPTEQTALADFKALLVEKQAYTPASDKAPASHDDQTLLRFLRARRWVAADAWTQFAATEAWRADNDLAALYASIDLAAYDQARRLYPQWTGRRDRRGIPLYLFEIRHLDSRTVSAYEKQAAASAATLSRARPSSASNTTPPRLLRLFALYENLTRFVQPLCSEMPDRPHAAATPITLSTNIVDVSGVSLRQFWNLKGHMQAASTLATAHYPETLDRIFIIGAPAFFSTVWGWIKRWFDPVTVSKIFILSSAEVLPTLQAFIDPENIPAQYGGRLDFAWGQMPNLDPAIVDRVAWEPSFASPPAFPSGPLYWRPLADDAARLECVAVGSEQQVDRMVRVGTVPRSCGVKAATEESAAGESTAGESTAGESAARGTGDTKTGIKADTAEAATDALHDLAISEKAQATTETVKTAEPAKAS